MGVYNNSFSVIPTEAEGSSNTGQDPSTTLGITTYKNNGFTLVELAIALMVIGLLIGGVLKGQELIENARVTSVLRQMNDYKSAVAIFQSTYDYLPGDIPNPSRRIPDCTRAPCSTTHGARLGNGMLDWYQFSPTSQFSRSYPRTYHQNNIGVEWRNFWVHMAKAGVISTSGLDVTSTATVAYEWTPATAIEGIYLGAITYVDSSIGSPINGPSLWLFNGPQRWDTPDLTPRQVSAMDSKIDDGKPVSGSFRVGPNGGTSSGTNPIHATCADTGTNEYLVATAAKVCGFVYDISP